ncbi:MAG: tRNA epoxyqueuosine(34) reductase QueG [Pseudomonadota bacterium]
MPTSTSEAAKRFLTADAKALGFDAIGFARAGDVGAGPGARLDEALHAAHHGDMAWLEETAPRRRHPRALWPEVNTVVAVGTSYAPGFDPLADLSRRSTGVVSVYAARRDYHDVLKGRLKTLGQRFVARFGGDLKVFVDTAPVMEKPLAALAGLGWQGKHTNLVSRDHGSWLFLGALFSTLALAPDAPHADQCGTCRRCLDVCPTDAFPAPYRLDARRCLAYLTIEAKHNIPRALRPAMGNRIFGCDDCLAVCPWNKFARVSRDQRLAINDQLRTAPLADLAALDDAAFRARFAGTPVKRLGRDRFVRNVVVAIGNSGEAALAGALWPRLSDAAGEVRAVAVWALRQLLPAGALHAPRAKSLALETDPAVRKEWD